MSPIFQIIPDEAKTAIKHKRSTTQVLTDPEPLQVIPEDEELNLNLKFNTPRSRSRRSLCKQPSKIEHLITRHTLSTGSPAPASFYRHRHSACPPTTTVPLCPSITHVCASWKPLPFLSVSKPSQPSENQFQSDLLFSTALQSGQKRSERPDSSDPLVQRCRRILMDDFKRAFPDGKVPDPFTLPKEECAYAA
jgi:hypothetical protein